MRTRTDEPHIITDAAELEMPALRRLFGEWRAACSTQKLAGLDFIDPLRLGYILGSLVILDVVQDRFRYRLVGTDLVARRGKDHTGLWIDEHDDRVTAQIGPRLCRVAIETRQAVRLRFKRRLIGQMYPGELLMLPVADDDGNVTRILAGQVYAPGAPKLGYGESA
jgi:hypothetical protein